MPVVNYGYARLDLNRIPESHTLQWDGLEKQILREHRINRPDLRYKSLMVVHPAQKILMEAVRCLDRDDWNPEWPTPYMRRHEFSLGGTWIILEDIPQFSLRN